MILNEDYFDNLKLTDEDIESSVIAPSSYDKYDNPKQMFIDMKTKYAHCIEIPLAINCKWKWKWDLPLILKRLLYIFDAYGVEYSEPTLQEFINVEQNLWNGYSQCNFIDYNRYKFISNSKTIEEADRNCSTISLIIFFNLPEVHSYKAACVFVSNILNCIRNNSIKDMTSGYFNVWDLVPVPYKRYISRKWMDYKIIELIIKMFFPEKSTTIKRELFADNNALLNKLLRCFGTYDSD